MSLPVNRHSPNVASTFKAPTLAEFIQSEFKEIRKNGLDKITEQFKIREIISNTSFISSAGLTTSMAELAARRTKAEKEFMNRLKEPSPFGFLYFFEK